MSKVPICFDPFFWFIFGSGSEVDMPRASPKIMLEIRKLVAAVVTQTAAMQSAVTAMHNLVHDAGRVSESPRTEPLRVSKSSSNSKRANSNEIASSESHCATPDPIMIEAPLDQCLGCPTMECVKSWRSFGDLPRDIESWMKNHDFFKPPSCSQHHQAHMVVVGKLAECRFVQRVVGERGVVCRERVHIYAPFLNTTSKIRIDTLFAFWSHVANNEGASSIEKNISVNKNTISSLFDRLGAACHLADTLSPPRFGHCAVDETYIGKRKFHRGKRTRKRGFWFVTLTEILRSGCTGATVWHLVKRRDKPTLERIVREHLVGSKTIVWTDEHRGYRGLGEMCRHFAVNHSKTFKTVEGVHTNHAEGVHGVVKRYLLQQHNRYGISSRHLRKHVALQCRKLLNAEVPSHLKWAHRMWNILTVCRSYYRCSGDEMLTVSSDTVSEAEEPELPHTKSGLQLRYTKTGLPRKTAKKEVAPSAKKHVGASTKDKNVACSFMEDVTASLAPGGALLAEVIVDALQSMLQTGYVVVDPRVAMSDINLVELPMDKTILWPVFYSGHWILAVLEKDSRTFPVYDSYRAFAHRPRTTALTKIQQAVKKRWGTWLKPQLKACDQQAVGSNDCGIHTINNALVVMGVNRSVTRKDLLLRWRRKGDEETLRFLDAIDAATGAKKKEQRKKKKIVIKKTRKHTKKRSKKVRRRRRWTPKKRKT